ncbi:hypothetical protein HIM_09378 [Hirsutella minnesotensis 3608]|uniref:Uncharacterized protein n=1 Tax=Hirsutella minnesotensis 3608 TaxID=1043627 RepID=A0A0F7ZLL6_9HYPO|nr:hypothetical protein HIM_09378 [Hirsutella minnesotensis 3608]
MSQSLRYVNNLQRRRVLVFGGTSGIGFCTAEAALENGAEVIISSSNPEKITRSLERLRSGAAAKGIGDTAQISGYACDLGDAAKVEENPVKTLDAATENGTRPLDHVAFSAGSLLKVPKIPEITVEDFHHLTQVRLVAPMILAKLLPRYMHQSVSSSLTLTSGTVGDRPLPGWAAISSCSAAVEGLGRGLALDLKPIRVNTVSPGAVNTEIFSDIPEDRLPLALENFKKSSLTNTVGTPEELAETYIYCMRNTFTTSSVIVADGGRIVA